MDGRPAWGEPETVRTAGGREILVSRHADFSRSAAGTIAWGETGSDLLLAIERADRVRAKYRPRKAVCGICGEPATRRDGERLRCDFHYYADRSQSIGGRRR